MTHLRPADEKELGEIIASASVRGEALELVAGGSKRGYGRKVEAAHTLDLSAFAGIRLYEPEELVLTAGAATDLGEIETALRAAGQHLAFEPPDWRHLWGANASPTLGGAIACNLAGPRRVRDGAARDHHLGFHAVSGRGESFKSGGRVVKNVTGYDLSKLMAGSFGTLAAMTEVTVKVMPAPEATRTLVLRSLDDARALAAMSAALAGPYEVSGAAHLPHGTSQDGEAQTLLRLEGHGPSVAARADSLARLLQPFDSSDAIGDEASLRLWRSVRDALPFADQRDDVAIWRLSVPPSEGPPLVAVLSRALDFKHFYDWGGGLVWLAVAGIEDGGAAAIRAALPAEGGHATLLRASDALRDRVPVFQPPAPALAALSGRVKSTFDPARILNPGRMYAGV
ncbi:MAG TPA: glycolate oxidase subunit GlcE [Stellaceae bacterium]|nr:glycolate oxidase subunit GlcE [Stellaceae bacterium]